MSIVQEHNHNPFRSLHLVSFENQSTILPSETDLSSLKSPRDMATFPVPVRSLAQCPSDPESTSPTSSVSTMGSTDLDSPPTKLAGVPSETKQRSGRSSPNRALPLRIQNSTVEPPQLAGPTDSQLPPSRLKPRELKKNPRNLVVRTNIRSDAPAGLPTAHIPMNLASQKYRVVSSPIDQAGPMLPPRRAKPPMGLTIQTPTTAFRAPILTPLTTRVQTLRQIHSTPVLKSPSSRFPPSCSPIQDGPDMDPTALDSDDENALESDIYEPNFDIPQSQEEKPDSYPDGPVTIYDSGIDLYLEPTAEIASRYDVVINVAVEVLNPFDPSRPPLSLSKFRNNPSIINNPIEMPSNSHGKTPEYLHIPWEHNTEIVEDLKILVKLISNRVSSGKKILIHCQCGVSRSASLIVAYGLYRRKDCSVQSMYNAVKRRSRWICPNMGLIMQLQEFHSLLNSPDGIGSSLRRASDDNLSTQSLLVPESFGAPAPLRTAPPRSGHCSSSTGQFFDLSVPPPSHRPDDENGLPAPNHANPPWPAAPPVQAASPRSDLFPSSFQSSQSRSNSFRQNSTDLENTSFLYSGPSISSIMSPRTEVFGSQIHKLHQPLPPSSPRSCVPLAGGAHTRFASLSPQSLRQPEPSNVGLAPISNNATAGFRKRRPDASIITPAQVMPFNGLDPRSPVQTQHQRQRQQQHPIWGSLS